MEFTTSPPPLLPVDEVTCFTHSSHHGEVHHTFEGPPGSHLKDYERLEHFGDAVLQLAVTELIWKLYKDVTVGGATKIRQMVVCNAYLAKVCAHYELQEKLIGSPISLRSLPRTRAALFESYLGAIYNQHGPIVTNEWIQQVFEPVVHTVYSAVKATHDGINSSPLLPTISTNGDIKSPLAELNEWAIGKGLGKPPTVVEQTGKSHDPLFFCRLTVDGAEYTGRGKKRKLAEHNAAQAALNHLKSTAMIPSSSAKIKIKPEE